MKTILSIFLLLVSVNLLAQHTFSIVAVDTVTGEVGGAGATCYETVNDIADVHPGVGYIHTQSYMNSDNQQYAKMLMDEGFSPQQIMDSLQVYDAENNSSIRQYAAVDLINGGRAAAFTGNNCYNYKGQRVGSNYAIAGNILLGAAILDSMESRFLNTNGTLADKLMAALQGAKVPGADSRCADEGVSSLSSYIIVAKPSDVAPEFYLSLNVENVLPTDPIDVLQQEFDNWKLTGIINGDKRNIIVLYPNPVDKELRISSEILLSKIKIHDFSGDTVYSSNLNSTLEKFDLKSFVPGVYFIEITDINKEKHIDKLIIK